MDRDPTKPVSLLPALTVSGYFLHQLSVPERTESSLTNQTYTFRTNVLSGNDKDQ